MAKTNYRNAIATNEINRWVVTAPDNHRRQIR